MCPTTPQYSPSSASRPSSSSPPAPISSKQNNANRAVAVSPCAACKILRRRCDENCMLAPYFPPTDPLKFANAHRVFGASNIIKLLQDVPECQRSDTASSLVYEANVRLRNPVYGCAGAISHLQEQVNDLQKQVDELQAQLVVAHVEMAAMQSYHDNLFALISSMGMDQPQHLPTLDSGNDSISVPQNFQSNQVYDMDCDLANLVFSCDPPNFGEMMQ